MNCTVIIIYQLTECRCQSDCNLCKVDYYSAQEYVSY